jgi:lysyl-tRNA synthetase class I
MKYIKTVQKPCRYARNGRINFEILKCPVCGKILTIQDQHGMVWERAKIRCLCGHVGELDD